MANFNDIMAQLYEIETHILLYALKEESSILPLLPQDILNNLQDILKQEKYDFDVEELEIFLKSKTNI